MCIHSDRSVDPAYPVYGGLYREEAIMLLRRFYVQENEKGECLSCLLTVFAACLFWGRYVREI